MLESLRIKNLRSLQDTGRVQLKPLTILLGENSCGKSTFLRTFPLLRQSAEANTRSSILWFGKYVDFGDFDQALTRTEGAKEIVFEFGMNVPSSFFYTNSRNMYRARGSFDPRRDTAVKLDIALRLSSLGKDGLTRTAGVDFSIDGNILKIDIAENGKISGININNKNYQEYCEYFDYQSASKILPVIRAKQDSSKERLYGSWWNMVNAHKVSEQLIQIISKYLHTRTRPQKRDMLVHFARVGSNQDMYIGFKTLDTTTTWTNKTKSISIDHPDYLEYRNLVLLNKIPIILHNLDDVLDYTFRRVSYIEPIRASAQRYYRSQDLAVSELDSKGENLAMFLRNLSERDRLSLESWTMSELGLKISAALEGGHVSLRITFSQSNQTYNLADMGFGFSQVIPVLVQLWTILNRTSKSATPLYPVPSICVIEQPELHLHPRFQARLAEILVKAAKTAQKNDIQLFIVLETHSEVIINKIGLMTAEEKLTKEDSSIVLFSKQSNTSSTNVELSSYDDSGSLQNWPFGFFDFEA